MAIPNENKAQGDGGKKNRLTLSENDLKELKKTMDKAHKETANNPNKYKGFKEIL